jgi:uncharacterized membrane protein
VNLKAELEIMLLHEKMDLLREGQWSELLAIQKAATAIAGGSDEGQAGGQVSSALLVALTEPGSWPWTARTS